MTKAETKKFKAALEANRLELVTQLRGRLPELIIEGGQPDLIEWVQRMSYRDETARILNRFSLTLADVERSLRKIDEDCYGICIRCHCAIPLKRLESIPWAHYCVRCQERVEAAAAESSSPDFDQPQAA